MFLLDIVSQDRLRAEDWTPDDKGLTGHSYDEVVQIINTAQRPMTIIFDEENWLDW